MIPKLNLESSVSSSSLRSYYTQSLTELIPPYHQHQQNHCLKSTPNFISISLILSSRHPSNIYRKISHLIYPIWLVYVCVCRKHFWLLIIITSHLNLIHNTIRVYPLEYALLMYVVSHSETESYRLTQSQGDSIYSNFQQLSYIVCVFVFMQILLQVLRHRAFEGPAPRLI